MHGSKNTSDTLPQQPLTGLSLIISITLHIISIILLIGIWGNFKKSTHPVEEPAIEVTLIEQTIIPDSATPPLEKKPSPPHKAHEVRPKKKLESLSPKSLPDILKKDKHIPIPPEPEASKPPQQTTIATQPPSLETGIVHDTSYALKVAHHIGKYKFYPLAARQRHETGNLLASITLDGQGNLIAHKIEKSSGSHILDHASLKALAQASPYPPPPENQDGITLKIPLNYTMDTRK